MIFLSYAKEDQDFALKIYNDLRQKGFRIWIDIKDILPGQKFEAAIRSAIKNCDYFLILLSSNSISKKGYVQKEIKIALEIFEEFPEDQIFIIPARIEECQPLNDALKRIQWVDFFNSYNEGLKRILNSLYSTRHLPSCYDKQFNSALNSVFKNNNNLESLTKSSKDRCLIWDTSHQIKSIRNPLDQSFLVNLEESVENFRVLALFLIPKINNESKAIELLFKKHPKWKNVFPSMEINIEIGDLKKLEEEVTARSKEIMYIGKINSFKYMGGLLTYKKSPTYFENNCYIFFFFQTEMDLEEKHLNSYRKGGKDFHFLTKEKAQSYDNKREVPNLDVLIALERLFGSWGVFRN